MPVSAVTHTRAAPAKAKKKARARQRRGQLTMSSVSTAGGGSRPVMRAPRGADQMLQGLLSGDARQQQGALASMRRRLAGAPLTREQRRMWEQLQHALSAPPPTPGAAAPSPSSAASAPSSTTPASASDLPILRPPRFAIGK